MGTITRRTILGGAAVAAQLASGANAPDTRPALLGGKPVRQTAFPSWPKTTSSEEEALIQVLRSGHWNRNQGTAVRRFEETWSQALGARRCLAVANGTSALFTSFNTLEIGPGDEVIVPPYTFVATINAVLLQHAMPVFVDTDLETMQIDAHKIEAAITPRTACVVPVHLGGSAADMDTVLAVARKHKLPVIEDACQAHLAEWQGRKLSTLGDLGCFSFQASKNLNSGEGGAVITNSEDLYMRASSFHNNGRSAGQSSLEYAASGCNLRMTEFQGALLLEQYKRLDEQSRTRERNAQYLTSMLKEIPGIAPARMYPGCTRNAYHLYMFRYNKEAFDGLPRAQFLKALKAEGIPCSSGYRPLNREPFLKQMLSGRRFQRVFGEREVASWEERNHCPVNDRLCEEAVWFTQTMLLETRSGMDQIAEAIRKIQRNGALLARA